MECKYHVWQLYKCRKFVSFKVHRMNERTMAGFCCTLHLAPYTRFLMKQWDVEEVVVRLIDVN